MEAENTKNGWVFTSRAQGLFTRQLHPTVPTRTASQKGQIERLWRESRLSSQKRNSTKDSGWNSRKRSYTSKIAVQQVQSRRHPTRCGTETNLVSHISE